LSSGVTAIATGGSHTCALVSGGVRCWGYNSAGELGNDSTTNSSAPVQVSGLTAGVTAVASGNYHACAIASGSVQCWGLNGYGQLGSAYGIDSHVPAQVSGLPNDLP